MDPVMVGLRLAHIGAGVFWVGAAWTFFLFIEPTLKALGPNAEKSFMSHVMRQRRLGQIIFLSTVVTVGAGAIMYWIDSNGFQPAFVASGFGFGITIGAVAAVIAFVIGPVFILPTVGRMEKIGTEIDAHGTPPTEAQMDELGRLGARLHTVGKIDAVLLAIAVVFMATARYL